MIWIIAFTYCVSVYKSEVAAEFKGVDYYLKLIDENIQKAENYTLPLDNRKYFGNSVPDESEAEDFGIFDFIIVGGGSSGSVIFNRLAEKRSWTILLLEAGGEEDDFSDIPSMMYYVHSSERNWGYKTTSQNTSCFGMVDNQCAYPRGKILGGSGTINALVYARGNKNDFDRWEEAGNPSWAYKDVLPYFKKSENIKISNIDESYHSRKGQLNVTYISDPFIKYFLGANEEMGARYIDYNGKSQIGCSPVQVNIDRGKRVSGGRVFINPVRKQENVRVVTNALVTKVLLKDQSAYGVNFLKNGKLYKATVKKEVILSAGAINTPQLLMLSGIGPKEHLAEFNIPVIKDLPVGKYFQDHIEFFLNCRNNYTSHKLTKSEMTQDYVDGKGYFPNAINHAISFINTINSKNFGSTVPDIEYLLSAPPIDPKIFFKAFNLRSDFSSTTFKDMNATNDFRLVVILLHPKSYGKISLKSKNPLDHPNIHTNYLSDENNDDIETIYQGIQYVLAMLQTETFKKLGVELSIYFKECDKNRLYSREYWYCAIRYWVNTIYHPMGTTRMGKNITNSVVDHKLRVHGIGSLRIADCGVIPLTTSGHLNAVAFMIGEKLADILKSEYKL